MATFQPRFDRYAPAGTIQRTRQAAYNNSWDYAGKPGWRTAKFPELDHQNPHPYETMRATQQAAPRQQSRSALSHERPCPVWEGARPASSPYYNINNPPPVQPVPLGPRVRNPRPDLVCTQSVYMFTEPETFNPTGVGVRPGPFYDTYTPMEDMMHPDRQAKRKIQSNAELMQASLNSRTPFFDPVESLEIFRQKNAADVGYGRMLARNYHH